MRFGDVIVTNDSVGFDIEPSLHGRVKWFILDTEKRVSHFREMETDLGAYRGEVKGGGPSNQATSRLAEVVSYA